MSSGIHQNKNHGFDAGSTGASSRVAAGWAMCLVILPVLAGLQSGCKPGVAQSTPPERVVQVVVAQPKRQAVSETLPLVGSILPDEMVEVKSETDGIVQSIHFLEGQEVEQGALLVQLDQTKLGEGLAESESNFKLSEANYQRNLQLFNDKLISQQEFDQVSAILHVNQATVNLRQRQLKDTHIVAPFSGLIGARIISPGQVISKNSTLTWLVDLEPVKVEINVPERFLGQLHLEQSIEISVAAFPERTFQGQVFFIAPFVDPDTRTALVKASIANPSHALKPGMFAHLELTLKVREHSLVIPEEALVKLLDQGEATVYVRDKDSRAQLKKVKVGMRLPGLVEILQGLDGTESVIVEGVQKLGPTVKVQVAAPAAKSADGPPPVERKDKSDKDTGTERDGGASR